MSRQRPQYVGSQRDKTLQELEPKEREILYCIQRNDLYGLEKIMNALTLNTRQKLCSLMIDKMTYFYIATIFGFTEIMQYLVIECGADVNRGYKIKHHEYLPLIAAVEIGNLRTVQTLVKLGTDLNWQKKSKSNCLVYACELRHLIIGQFLKLNGANINCDKNVFLCSKSKEYCQRSFMLGADLDFRDSRKRTAFIMAAMHGRIEVVNYLLAKDVNTRLRDESGLNALCASILNKKHSMTQHLQIFVSSQKDFVLALEFCGASLVMNDNNAMEALDYWAKSLKYRIKSVDRMPPKIKPDQFGPPFERGEFLTLYDLMYISQDLKKIVIEALLIYIRVLSINSPITHDAFSNAILMGAFMDDFSGGLQINDHLFSFYDGISTPFFSAAEKAIVNMVAFIQSFLEYLDLSDAALITDRFDMAFDFLRNHIWKSMREKPYNQKIFNQYFLFLGTIVDFLDITLNFKLTDFQMRRLMRQINVIGNVYFDQYPTSILHVAIHMDMPTTVLSFIIKSGANVNFQDETRSLPIHLLLEHPIASVRSKLILLLDSGSHLDAVNSFSYCPLSLLGRSDILPSNSRLLSLQCLAASAIRNNRRVIFQKDYPKHLKDFINLH